MTFARIRAAMMPRSRAAVRSWTAPGRAGEAHTRRPAASAMTCTLTPWRLCLPEVVRLLVGDAVDRNQRAVQDRVRQRGRPGCGGLQVVGLGGEQIDPLAYVAPR